MEDFELIEYDPVIIDDFDEIANTQLRMFTMYIDKISQDIENSKNIEIINKIKMIFCNTSEDIIKMDVSSKLKVDAISSLHKKMCAILNEIGSTGYPEYFVHLD